MFQYSHLIFVFVVVFNEIGENMHVGWVHNELFIIGGYLVSTQR